MRTAYSVQPLTRHLNLKREIAPTMTMAEYAAIENRALGSATYVAKFTPTRTKPSAQQAVILDYIRNHPGACVKTICAATGIKRTTFNSLTQRLRDKGYKITMKRNGRGGVGRYWVEENAEV